MRKNSVTSLLKQKQRKKPVYRPDSSHKGENRKHSVIQENKMELPCFSKHRLVYRPPPVGKSTACSIRFRVVSHYNMHKSCQ